MKQATLMASIWADLSPINVNENVQKKGNLSYLSWTWAWSTLMSKYPDSYYFFEDRKFEDGSFEVTCVLTIHDGEDSVTRSMWLPVMDHRNKSIINPDSRAISDSKMRCLVKCLAMFGLGFYIYSGEDIPVSEKDSLGKPISSAQADVLREAISYSGTSLEKFCKHFKIEEVSQLKTEFFAKANDMLQKKIYAMESETNIEDKIQGDVKESA